MSRLALGCLIGLGVLGLLLLFSGLAVADTCALSLALSPSEREAKVNVGGPTAVTFSGSFWAVAAPEPVSQVDFTVTVSTGWTATASPASVGFDPPDGPNGTINVTVIVPTDAPASVEGVVHVVGRASSGLAMCGTSFAEVRVTPLPYFRVVDIRAAPPVADVDPTTGVATVDFTLNAKTNAAGPATVRFRLHRIDGLTNDAPAELELVPTGGGHLSGSVTVRFVPPNSSPHTYPVKARAIIVQPNQTGIVTPNQTGIIHVFENTPAQIRVLSQPLSGAVIVFTAVGALATLSAAWWVWQGARPRGP